MNIKKLKGARAEKGFTQEQMAKILGITPKTYNRKELGMVEFNRKELLGLCEALDLDSHSVNEIFFENKLTNWLN